MPVRSHGKLLAGIGALLGVCAAGCQSPSLRNGPVAADSGVSTHRTIAVSQVRPPHHAAPIGPAV